MARPWLNHSLLLLATAVLILLPTGCEKAQSDNETQIEAATAEESHENEKPLLLDDERPLLLDAPAARIAGRG